MSGRAVLQGLIDCETDPNRLLAWTSGRLKADPDRLRPALKGRVGDHHRFLLQLDQQVTALEEGLRRIDTQLRERPRPFEALTTRSRTMPGVSHVVAHTVVAEIGVNMERFRHLVTCGLGWACVPASTKAPASGGRPGSVKVRRG